MPSWRKNNFKKSWTIVAWNKWKLTTIIQPWIYKEKFLINPVRRECLQLHVFTLTITDDYSQALHGRLLQCAVMRQYFANRGKYREKDMRKMEEKKWEKKWKVRVWIAWRICNVFSSYTIHFLYSTCARESRGKTCARSERFLSCSVCMYSDTISRTNLLTAHEMHAHARWRSFFLPPRETL